MIQGTRVLLLLILCSGMLSWLPQKAQAQAATINFGPGSPGGYGHGNAGQGYIAAGGQYSQASGYGLVNIILYASKGNQSWSAVCSADTPTKGQWQGNIIRLSAGTYQCWASITVIDLTTHVSTTVSTPVVPGVVIPP